MTKRAVGEGHDPSSTSVSMFVSAQPMTVRPQDPLTDAAALMEVMGVRHMPVVDAGKPVGILSIRDVLRFQESRG